MPSAPQTLHLRQQLTRRLIPIGLLIGSLISLGFPAAYYVLESEEVRRLATAEAHELAERLGPLFVEVPALWKYQAPKYHQVLDEVARHDGVIAIQVRDASDEPVPEYAYSAAPSGRWAVPVAYGTAPLFINNQRMGSVSVGISQAPLLTATLRLFLLSTVVGVAVGLLACLYPVRVVTRLEGRTDDLVDALSERTRQLEAVQAVAAAITREPDLTAVLNLVNQRAVELVGAASSTVRLWDQEAQRLVPAAWSGVGEWMRGRRLQLGEGISGRVAQRRAGLIVNDDGTSPYASSLPLERAGISAVLAEPLVYRDRLLGVLTVDHEETGRTFTERDREMLAPLVAQAAIAVENARPHMAAAPPSE